MKKKHKKNVYTEHTMYFMNISRPDGQENICFHITYITCQKIEF